VYGRYGGDGNAAFTLHGNVAGHELAQKGDLAFPASDDANPEIERMWAWHRVDRLLKDADNAGDRSGVTSEIVRLGEAYSIATEYTSFIVLENDGEYQRWHIARKNALRIERDRASEQRVTDELAALRTKSVASIGPMNNPKQFAIDTPAPAPVDQVVTPTATPLPSTDRPLVQRQPGQSYDFSVPSAGGHGGGAIDPFTALMAIGVGAASLRWYLKRVRRDVPIPATAGEGA